MKIQHNIETKSRMVAIFFAITLFWACAEKKPVTPSSGANLAGQIQRMDPDAAQARLLDPQPVLGSANEVSSLQVPVFTIGFDGADMVQILRCNKDFVLRTPTGQEFQSILTGKYKSEDIEQAKWVWQEAIGFNRECKLLGSNISRTNFQDVAAGSGDFYYVLNPCVSEPLSTTGKEGCSYRLSRSNSIVYTNTLSKEFIAQSQELADMEGTLTAHFNNLILIAGQIKDTVVDCEDMFAHEQARKSFMKGIVSLAAMVVGAVIGAYMGGPMGAVQGGQLALGLARGLMGNEKPDTLECPAATVLFDDMEHTRALLEPQVARVIEVRTKMAGLESSYADLDRSIASQTGSGGSSNTSAPASNTEIPAESSEEIPAN